MDLIFDWPVDDVLKDEAEAWKEKCLNDEKEMGYHINGQIEDAKVIDGEDHVFVDVRDLIVNVEIIAKLVEQNEILNRRIEMLAEAGYEIPVDTPAIKEFTGKVPDFVNLEPGDRIGPWMIDSKEESIDSEFTPYVHGDIIRRIPGSSTISIGLGIKADMGELKKAELGTVKTKKAKKDKKKAKSHGKKMLDEVDEATKRIVRKVEDLDG